MPLKSLANGTQHKKRVVFPFHLCVKTITLTSKMCFSARILKMKISYYQLVRYQMKKLLCLWSLTCKHLHDHKRNCLKHQNLSNTCTKSLFLLVPQSTFTRYR